MVPTTLYVIYMLFSGYEEQPNIYMGSVSGDYRIPRSLASEESQVTIPESPLMITESSLTFPRSGNGKNLMVESSVHKRSVDAKDVELGQFPSVVLLRNLTNDPPMCSGFIVNQYWAATAARCVYGVEPRDIVLVSSTIDLYRGGNNHEVEEVLVHSEFILLPLYNDIAVLKVSRPFEFGPFVQPSYLPGSFFTMAPLGTLVGWGSQQRGGPMSSKLKTATVVYMHQIKCNKILSRKDGYKILSSQLCGYGWAEGEFNGDIGSPMIMNGIIVGIVSWTQQCGDSSLPEIYTKIAYFTDWINTVTGTNS